MSSVIVNYIYLLQEREFIKTKENIYKVGKTSKENHKRFNQYPKGSILLFQIICENCHKIEKQIITKFKEEFKQRTDIGSEYFEGDYKSMIDVIYISIKNEKVVKHISLDNPSNQINLPINKTIKIADESDKKIDQISKKFETLYERLYIIFSKYNIEELDEEWISWKNDYDEQHQILSLSKKISSVFPCHNYILDALQCKANSEPCRTESFNFTYDFIKLYKLLCNIFICGRDNLSDNLQKNIEILENLHKNLYIIFPNYMDDEVFGGDKMYIKVKKIENSIVFVYINERLLNQVIDNIYYRIDESDGEDDIPVDIFIQSIRPVILNDNKSKRKNNAEKHTYRITEINQIMKMYNSTEDRHSTELDIYIVKNDIRYINGDNYQYLQKLLNQKILTFGETYDLNSHNVINKFIKTKKKITLENYEEFERFYKGCEKLHVNDLGYAGNMDDICKFGSGKNRKIRQLFLSNMIINDKFYATMSGYGKNFWEEYKKEPDNIPPDIFKIFDKLKNYDKIYINIRGEADVYIVQIYKIRSRYYEYTTCLRRYIPYLIRWRGNGEYYIMNREYEYIGLNTKSIDDPTTERCYLFNDGCPPWQDKQSYNNAVSKYYNIIKENSLKTCMNPNSLTNQLMVLID